MKLKRIALWISTVLLSGALFIGCGKADESTVSQTIAPVTLPPTPDMPTPTIEETVEPSLEDPVPVFGSSVTAAPYTQAPSPTATPKPTEKTSNSSSSKSSSSKKNNSNSSSTKTAKPSSNNSSSNNNGNSSGIDFDDIPSETDSSSDSSSTEVDIPIDDSDLGDDSSSDDEIPVVEE